MTSRAGTYSVATPSAITGADSPMYAPRKKPASTSARDPFGAVPAAATREPRNTRPPPPPGPVRDPADPEHGQARQPHPDGEQRKAREEHRHGHLQRRGDTRPAKRDLRDRAGGERGEGHGTRDRVR